MVAVEEVIEGGADYERDWNDWAGHCQVLAFLRSPSPKMGVEYVQPLSNGSSKWVHLQFCCVQVRSTDKQFRFRAQPQRLRFLIKRDVRHPHHLALYHVPR